MSNATTALAWLSHGVLVMVVLVAIMILALSSQKQLFGWQLLIVKSGSMAPTIPTGSLILVKAQPHYAIGEVVTYRQPTSNSLITHRITDEKQVGQETSYTLQGDANTAPDVHQVAAASITGKMVFLLPLVGYVLSFLQTPVGVIIGVVIPGTLLIYEQLRAIHRQVSHLTQRSVIMGLLGLGSLMIFSSGTTLAEYAASTRVQPMTFTTTRWLTPTADYNLDQGNLLITIADGGGVDRVDYEITYTHQVDGNEIQEQMIGQYSKAVEVESATLPSLFLGTCSEADCTPHQDISNLIIKLSFKHGETEVALIELSE